MGSNVSLHEREAAGPSGEGVPELSVAELEAGLREGRDELRRWRQHKKLERTAFIHGVPLGYYEVEIAAGVARIDGRPSERMYFVGGPIGGSEILSVGQLASSRIKMPSSRFGHIEYIRVADVNGRMVYAWRIEEDNATENDQ